MSTCCLSGCKNRHSSTSKLKLYRIPSGYRPFQANRRRLWLQAIQAVNGSTDGLGGNARVCSAHFISGEASMDHDSPDFVPSVFTCSKPCPKPRRKVKGFYSRRRRRRRKASTEKEEKSIVGFQSSDPMETECEHSQEIQTKSILSVLKEGETLAKEVETEAETSTSPTTTILNKTLPSFRALADRLKLDKKRPVVILKHVVAPAGGYRCEVCSQNFSSVSQLVKHDQLHEEGSFICEICGKFFTVLGDFTEHQRVHKAESFSCNMCDRSFATNHELKRHKLLHVKDGRKCSKCGVLFCQRHNHILFLPQPEPLTKSEQDSFIIESQNENSDLMLGNGTLEKPKPSKTARLGDNDKSLSVLPFLITTVQAVLPTPPNPEPSSSTCKDPSPPLHTKTPSDIPVQIMLKSSPLPCPPPPVPWCSVNRGTSFQCKQPLPDYPTAFVQPNLSQHPELPPSLKIFSPQFLTSTLLEVKRNYKYILSKPGNVKKEEQCEQPLISPGERGIEPVRKERIAYDLEIVL